MLENIKNTSPKFKDPLIAGGWIVGILIIGGLLWYFTQDFRENRMLRTINAVLIQNNDKRRLQSALDDQRFSVVSSNGTAVLMTVYNNSIPSVYAVFLDEEGAMNDILPLDNHSAQALERLEKVQLDMYIQDAEEHEKRVRNGE
jgi:hypothetical protein